jgi:glucose/arabinose dehydrogenase
MIGTRRAASAVVALVAAAAAVTACAPSQPPRRPDVGPAAVGSANPDAHARAGHRWRRLRLVLAQPVPEQRVKLADATGRRGGGHEAECTNRRCGPARWVGAGGRADDRTDPSGAAGAEQAGPVDPETDRAEHVRRRRLLDIALSPSYAEDRLMLALITTKRDTRVVHFTANGPVTPILTGIPRGKTDNVGRLLVLSDGSVLVGTGDAGIVANAPKLSSRGGKVLRMDELGRPASGNPHPRSVVYTSGHRTVNGLCFDDAHSVIYETEDGATGELNRIVPGTDYGWPAGDGQGPVADIPDTPGLGSCAVLKDTIYVGSLGGKALLRARIDPTTGTISAFTPLIAGQYGRLLTVVGANDGSLWITTSNKDGHGKPVPADERVLHITPDGGGGGNSPE